MIPDLPCGGMGPKVEAAVSMAAGGAQVLITDLSQALGSVFGEVGGTRIMPD